MAITRFKPAAYHGSPSILLLPILTRQGNTLQTSLYTSMSDNLLTNLTRVSKTRMAFGVCTHDNAPLHTSLPLGASNSDYRDIYNHVGAISASVLQSTTTPHSTSSTPMYETMTLSRAFPSHFFEVNFILQEGASYKAHARTHAGPRQEQPAPA